MSLNSDTRGEWVKLSPAIIYDNYHCYVGKYIECGVCVQVCLHVCVCTRFVSCQAFSRIDKTPHGFGTVLNIIILHPYN